MRDVFVMSSIGGLISGFSNYPRISRLLRDSNSFNHIEQYLIDNQAIELSHCFLLWMSILKFKAIKVTPTDRFYSNALLGWNNNG